MSDVIEIKTIANEAVEVITEGPQGAPGVGVPTGGSALQVLRKKSGTDYDTEWATGGGGGGVSSWNDLEDKPATFAPSAHTHPISDVTNLQTALDGKAASSHAHGNLTNAGAIGTTANFPLKTGTGGVIEAGSFGTAAGTFCEGNDSRLSDSRTPSNHAASHLPSGADELFDQSLNTTDSPEFVNVNALNGDLVLGNVGGSGGIYGFGRSLDIEQGIISNFSIEASDQFTTLFNETDNTKVAQFSSAGITTGTTRTFSFPDASGTLALQGAITTSGLTQSTARILGRTTASTGAVEEIQIGSGLSLSAGQLSATGGVTTGAVDNAIIRADGTGGSTSQSSDVIIDDPVVAYAVTGDASTDIITAVGHNFTNNQVVRFQNLVGGSGLFSGGPASSTNYFVRDISGNTFRIASSSGGAAINFTTNITSGAVVAVQRNITLRTRKQAFAMTANASNDTITATGHTFVDGDAVSFYNLVGGAGLDEVTRWFVRDAATDTFKVSISATGAARDITTNYTSGTVELEVPLVLGVPRFGGLILGDKPDGTIVGGNIRGYGAVDLQTNRNGQNAIASGTFSFIGGGQNNTASALRSLILGGSGNTSSAQDAVVAGGENGQATASWAFVAGGTGNISSGAASFSAGASNTMQSSQTGAMCGRNALGDRDFCAFHATGRFGAQGDAQTVRASLRNRVSTATPVELFMGFSSDTRFAIPSGKTMAALITIVAATSGGEFANRYVRAVTIANRGGTTALRGAVKDLDTDEQIAGADVTISANDTNDAIRIEFSGVAPVTGCTAAASTDVITKTGHGFSNNDDIVFTSLTGGAGLTANTVTYWVINASANDFQVSATRGGAAVNITTDYSDMTAARLFRVVASLDGVDVGHGT